MAKKVKRTKKVQAKVLKQNVGCDISKDDFKVSFQQLLEGQHIRIKASRTFKNTKAGFLAFLTWIDKKRVQDIPVRVTLEATGVYYEQLVYCLDDHDIYVSVLLGTVSSNYMKSLNINSKTDKIDAKALGQMGLERDLEQWKPSSPNARTIKQLTRDRVSLLEEKTALSNKLHALMHAHESNEIVIKRVLQRIKLVQRQIKEADKDIQNALKKDENMAQHVEHICKAKGIGVITATTIIAETDGFNLFTSRAQLVSYAGYDIVQKQSGTSVNGKTRISKKGNKYIRRALYFPSIVIVQHEEVFKQLYKRVLKRTGVKKKALVAVQRKILVLIYSLYKNNQEFDPNFHKTESNKKDENTVVLNE